MSARTWMLARLTGAQVPQDRAVAELDAYRDEVRAEVGQELAALRVRVAELEAERAAVTAALEPRWDLHLDTQMHVLQALTTAAPEPLQRQAEDPHDSPLHHDYALGRDLPEVRS
ncbi:hypothetical protein ACFY7C_12180 [Streptomyces sp. NPDC012769]|uniref:hypothetical protein n=1 Tax=Streptomyces sp. NPDC012769 TaxID=3364848 RepID=UPI0036C3BA0A